MKPELRKPLTARLRGWTALRATILLLSLLAPCGNAAMMLTTMFAFDGTNGAGPEATLVQGADGFLYGTTICGGTNGAAADGGFGTIFRISTNGEFRTLVHLNYPTGSNPQSGLIQGKDGNFYGVTDYGGDRGSGAVYRMSPDGVFTPLASFAGLSGVYPHGLTEGADGCFYGTAYYGGASPGFEGTVFKVTTNGALTALCSFNGTNGANPQAPLLRATDGNFYGTTVEDGTNGGLGTLFRISPGGELTSLVSFNGTNGARPMSALLQDVDGNIYGTTSTGGFGFSISPPTGNGTVFKVTPQGELSTLHQFAGYPDDGAHPAFGGLTRGTDGNFYGTTEAGGANASGTTFRMTPDGTLSVLYSFSRPDYDTGTNLDGYSPSAGLIQATDGNLYGVTMEGGLFARGTIFRLTINADPPVIQIGPQSGGLLRLTWNTITDREYQLQSIASVDSTNWTNSGLSITATNTITTASVSIGPERQWFYRVVLLP
jgi:uncharacterized repeat protein (TIGR03803 family)